MHTDTGQPVTNFLPFRAQERTMATLVNCLQQQRRPGHSLRTLSDSAFAIEALCQLRPWGQRECLLPACGAGPELPRLRLVSRAVGEIPQAHLRQFLRTIINGSSPFQACW